MSEYIIGHALRNLARDKPLLSKLLWRLDYGMIWSLITLFRVLPIDTASRLGGRVGALLGRWMERKSGLYRANLAVACPDTGVAELDAMVTKAWGNAGRVLAEYPHLDTILQDPQRLEIVIREPIVTYTNPEQPCVIVTAHLSNWEVVCSAMARLGIPNASLYSPPKNPYLDKMLLESRGALNCQLLPRDNSARLLMRALKQGRTAAMVMDRRIDEGKSVRFFGVDKPATVLPAKLALKHHCDLVPVQVERLQDAHFRVTFHPPLRPADPTAGKEEQALDLTQQIHHHFEDWIRAEPSAWFCSQRIWPRRKLTPTDKADTGPDIDSYAA
jgi:KDO2-lipid IV(A) lauroyltransferase